MVSEVSEAPVKVRYGVTPAVRAAGVWEMVPVAVRLAKVKVLEMRALPWTEKRAPGVVVPMPTEPPLVAK